MSPLAIRSGLGPRKRGLQWFLFFTYVQDSTWGTGAMRTKSTVKLQHAFLADHSIYLPCEELEKSSFKVMEGHGKVKVNSLGFSCLSSCLVRIVPHGSSLTSRDPFSIRSLVFPNSSVKERHINGMLSSFSLCLQKCLENLNNYRLLPFKG